MKNSIISSDNYRITGFPSPCAEYHEPGLSLDQRYRLGHPGVFVIEVSGHSQALGLRAGDKLIVDRSLRPQKDQLVVMVVGQEFRIGPFRLGTLAMEDTGEGDFVWGVVVALVRELK